MKHELNDIVYVCGAMMTDSENDYFAKVTNVRIEKTDFITTKRNEKGQVEIQDICHYYYTVQDIDDETKYPTEIRDYYLISLRQYLVNINSSIVKAKAKLDILNERKIKAYNLLPKE